MLRIERYTLVGYVTHAFWVPSVGNVDSVMGYQADKGCTSCNRLSTQIFTVSFLIFLFNDHLKFPDSVVGQYDLVHFQEGLTKSLPVISSQKMFIFREFFWEFFTDKDGNLRA